MLTEVRIDNFRCFAKHKIGFRKLTVAVGKNNAGKSTLVEALRIISLLCARHRTSQYKSAPPAIEAPIGIQPSLESLELDEGGIFNQYGQARSCKKASVKRE